MAKFRRTAIFILVIVLIVAGLFLIGEARSYTDYTIENTTEHVDTKTTKYASFGEYLLKYGDDGITCVDRSDKKVWNQSYEMDSPVVAIEGTYVAAADRNGRQLYIFDTTGYLGKVDTIYRIQQIDIAENGTTTAILENSGIYYLVLYDSKGNELARGTIHLENSGYPISAALSNDGYKLAVSFVNISEASLKSTVTIYNFDSVGQNEIDNIVTNDEYEGIVIPRVEFLDADTCVAFGSSQIMLYTGTQKPTLSKTITFDREINSIFYGPETFGVIVKNDANLLSASGDAKEETGIYQITSYSKNGRQIFSKGFDLSYDKVTVLDNKEICIQGENAILIYSRYGLERFKYQFDEKTKLVRSTGRFQTYDFVFETRTENVRLS